MVSGDLTGMRKESIPKILADISYSEDSVVITGESNLTKIADN